MWHFSGYGTPPITTVVKIPGFKGKHNITPQSGGRGTQFCDTLYKGVGKTAILVDFFKEFFLFAGVSKWSRHRWAAD